MLTGKSSHKSLKLSHSLGHTLLLTWLLQDEKRKALFESCIKTSMYSFDLETVKHTINSAAYKCMEEFIELYPDIMTGELEDILEIQDLATEPVIN